MIFSLQGASFLYRWQYLTNRHGEGVVFLLGGQRTGARLHRLWTAQPVWHAPQNRREADGHGERPQVHRLPRDECSTGEPPTRHTTLGWKHTEGRLSLARIWRNSYFQSFWATLHCALEKEHVSNGLQAAKSVGFTAHIAKLTPVTVRRQVCSPCLSPLLDLKGLRLEIASLCFWDSMKDDCHCHGQLWQRQFDVLPSRAF